MPPSPQPDSNPPKPSLRRASSLPPEASYIERSPSPVTRLKRMRITVPEPEDEAQEDTLDMEELSPEAIIPDSVNILRDPEVELPDDDEREQEDSEEEITAMKLDRTHDESYSESSSHGSPDSRARTTAKRKYASSDTSQESRAPRRKRPTTPMTLRTFRGKD